MGFTYVLKCAVSGEEVKYVGRLFVDNAVCFSNHGINNKQRVMQQVQDMQAHLDDLIKATEGAVNPQSTFGDRFSSLGATEHLEAHTKILDAVILKPY